MSQEWRESSIDKLGASQRRLLNGILAIWREGKTTATVESLAELIANYDVFREQEVNALREQIMDFVKTHPPSSVILKG